MDLVKTYLLSYTTFLFLSSSHFKSQLLMINLNDFFLMLLIKRHRLKKNRLWPYAEPNSPALKNRVLFLIHSQLVKVVCRSNVTLRRTNQQVQLLIVDLIRAQTNKSADMEPCSLSLQINSECSQLIHNSVSMLS